MLIKPELFYKNLNNIYHGPSLQDSLLFSQFSSNIQSETGYKLTRNVVIHIKDKNDGHRDQLINNAKQSSSYEKIKFFRTLQKCGQNAR